MIAVYIILTGAFIAISKLLIQLWFESLNKTFNDVDDLSEL